MFGTTDAQLCGVNFQLIECFSFQTVFGLGEYAFLFLEKAKYQNKLDTVIIQYGRQTTLKRKYCENV